MATVERPPAQPTHEVLNQPPPLEGYNLFADDAALVEALRREGGDWAEDQARELGALCGLPQTIRWGVEANQNPPKLRTHDRFGNRVDEVEFHPAWHELMRIGVGHGLHALPWRQPQPGAHVARGAHVHAPGPGGGGGGLPDLDDLLGDPGASNAAGAGGRVGAALPVAVLRRRAARPGS